MDKATLRARLREREGVTSEESQAVVTHLAGWLADRPRARVLMFLPMSGEVDLTPVVGPPHEWFVTRTPSDGSPLTIHPYDSPREVHRFGYEQPIVDMPSVDPATLDLVLTPALAFDRRGNRIGWGKGYYDRLLAEAVAAGAVGITLDRLIVDELPVEAHDRRVDWLATDSGVSAVANR